MAVWAIGRMLLGTCINKVWNVEFFVEQFQSLKSKFNLINGIQFFSSTNDCSSHSGLVLVLGYTSQKVCIFPVVLD